MFLFMGSQGISVRAFASFLLLLAALPIILLLPSPARSPDLSGSIALESAYYNSAGIKDAIIASVRLGASDGRAEYLARVAAKDETANLQEIVRTHVHARLAALSDSLPPDSLIWCGPVDSEALLDNAGQTRAQKSPALCAACAPISDSACADYISVDPVSMEVWLENPAAMRFAGSPEGIGISSYADGIGQASFIPNSKRVGFG